MSKFTAFFVSYSLFRLSKKFTSQRSRHLKVFEFPVQSSRSENRSLCGRNFRLRRTLVYRTTSIQVKLCNYCHTVHPLIHIRSILNSVQLKRLWMQLSFAEIGGNSKEWGGYTNCASSYWCSSGGWLIATLITGAAAQNSHLCRIFPWKRYLSILIFTLTIQFKFTQKRECMSVLIFNSKNISH